MMIYNASLVDVDVLWVVAELEVSGVVWVGGLGAALLQEVPVSGKQLS